jgi:hypothetical protein
VLFFPEISKISRLSVKLKIPLFFCVVFVCLNTAAAEQKYLTVPEYSLRGQVRTNFDSPTPTREQLRRKEKFTKMVAALGVPTTNSLPVVEDAGAIQLRTVDEISKRAIAVAIAAVKGEGMPHDEVTALIRRWGVEGSFSAQELAFVKNPHPTQSDRAKFTWRYEGVDVLLWALGYNVKLPSPNVICDVKADTKLIVANGTVLLAKHAKRRSVDEVLDMADYYYRLHWGAIELRLKNKRNSSVSEEIVMERHYALNWLIRYMGKDWDEVPTDT